MPRRPKTELALGIAARLRALRARAGLSQRQVAERANISAETVSRSEKGSFAPELTTLQRFAQVLGCQLSELVDLERSPPTGLGDLDEEERELVRRWRRLDPASQAAFLHSLAAARETEP